MTKKTDRKPHRPAPATPAAPTTPAKEPPRLTRAQREWLGDWDLESLSPAARVEFDALGGEIFRRHDAVLEAAEASSENEEPADA